MPLEPKQGLELFYDLNIHGDAAGADGMALWLQSKPVQTAGPWMGGPTSWTGAVVLLDTFDNDGKVVVIVLKAKLFFCLIFRSIWERATTHAFRC